MTTWATPLMSIEVRKIFSISLPFQKHVCSERWSYQAMVWKTARHLSAALKKVTSRAFLTLNAPGTTFSNTPGIPIEISKENSLKIQMFFLWGWELFQKFIPWMTTWATSLISIEVRKSFSISCSFKKPVCSALWSYQPMFRKTARHLSHALNQKNLPSLPHFECARYNLLEYARSSYCNLKRKLLRHSNVSFPPRMRKVSTIYPLDDHLCHPINVYRSKKNVFHLLFL